jgi:hypothetical protein
MFCVYECEPQWSPMLRQHSCVHAPCTTTRPMIKISSVHSHMNDNMSSAPLNVRASAGRAIVTRRRPRRRPADSRGSSDAFAREREDQCRVGGNPLSWHASVALLWRYAQDALLAYPHAVRANIKAYDEASVFGRQHKLKVKPARVRGSWSHGRVARVPKGRAHAAVWGHQVALDRRADLGVTCAHCESGGDRSEWGWEVSGKRRWRWWWWWWWVVGGGDAWWWWWRWWWWWW